MREASYATIPPLSFKGRAFHFAPLGPVAIILANIVTLMVLCFYKLDTRNQWKWEDVGYRTGFITIAQLPLIFLLAGRQNIVGYLAGMGYERLNWFHRWVSRTLWLTATIHMGFWFRDWGQYDYITYQLKNDALAKRGFAAWIILSFIIISSAAPVRNINYEFFVLQHLITFVGFIVAVWLHAPNEVKAWVWIPIGLLIFDRVARYAWATYANLSIFHRSLNPKHPIWANRASFTPLPGNVTRITIENPGISWKPGQHVFLTCHSIVPLQCHPFTIVSLPGDNKMEFLIRAAKGGTKRLFRYASKNHQIVGSGETLPQNGERTVFIDGPYGMHRPLRQFDSVVLLAGGTGATFIIPCLRDIVMAWKGESQQQNSKTRQAATKRIRFVWVIKSRAHLSWFDSQLQKALAAVDKCRSSQPDLVREIEMSIYVTCDEALGPTTTTMDRTICSQAQVATPYSAKTYDEKGAITQKENKVTVQPIPSSSSSNQPATGCLPNGGCCCTNRIEDEKEITEQHCCTCSGHAAVPTSPVIENSIDEKITLDKTPMPNTIPILSGRPQPRTIIRKVLEKAEGESAVVVCGPRGLSDEVRRSVVSLSDERAVHKGTGAQGIYLHVESFGW